MAKTRRFLSAWLACDWLVLTVAAWPMRPCRECSDFERSDFERSDFEPSDMGAPPRTRLSVSVAGSADLVAKHQDNIGGIARWNPEAIPRSRCIRPLAQPGVGQIKLVRVRQFDAAGQWLESDLSRICFRIDEGAYHAAESPSRQSRATHEPRKHIAIALALTIVMGPRDNRRQERRLPPEMACEHVVKRFG